MQFLDQFHPDHGGESVSLSFLTPFFFVVALLFHSCRASFFGADDETFQSERSMLIGIVGDLLSSAAHES